jgi:Cu(I)/Ag(I) efflux system membrane fusion protein
VAQQELLIEYRSWLAERGKKSSEAIRAGNMFAQVKKRLDLWGLTDKNILEILKSGKVRDHVTLYAPIKGIVIHKNAVEGKYFKTGDRLFTLADLSKLWVNLDAYESDLKWLRYGQKVVFTTDAWPGETFSGRISFISPVMDKQTRTVNVRLNVDNSSGRLKPEMIVSAVVKVRIDRDIKVIAADLKDKWMCPMHPSVLKSKPGKCDICGMDLLKTEELGYASGKGGDSQPPLVIPDTAPLLTGKRAVVYVKSAPGSFQAREVVLGPRAGGYYVVKKGLRQGDLVVTKGNFKIDSELQIKAGKSMMSMPSQMRMSDKEHKAHVHNNVPKKSPDGLSAEQKKIFGVGLQNVYSVYFVIQQALSKDDLKSAIAAAKDFKGRLSKIKKPEQDAAAWEKLSSELKDVGAEFVKTGGNIVKARELFRNLSSVVYRIAKRYGSGGKIKIYRMFCPMAFDNKGAYWLQDKPEVTNPYYGSVMYRCGSKEEDVAK